MHFFPTLFFENKFIPNLDVIIENTQFRKHYFFFALSKFWGLLIFLNL